MTPPPLTFRTATVADAPALAAMNQHLIRDEGHRNTMNIEQLTTRMRRWLQNEYTAVLFSLPAASGAPVGYALFRRDPDWIYLRQFFVEAQHRLQGMGRAAIEWMKLNPWANAPAVRIEVLATNPAGLAFWQSTGFLPYAQTFELPLNNTAAATLGKES